MGEKGNAYRVLAGNPEGKRQLGRFRCRWEDNIKIDHKETGWGGMDWIYVTYYNRDYGMALMNTVMNFRLP
jgi:hypothetical protein